MESGVDPTLAAVLPLVGVVLGVLLAVGVELWRRSVERRDAIREAKRLLRADLLVIEGLANMAAERTERLPDLATERLLRVPDAWETHRSVLARSLPAEDWSRLVRLVLRLQQLRYGSDVGMPHASLRKTWAALSREVVEAREHLGESRRRQ